jgi:hypothetical protein
MSTQKINKTKQNKTIQPTTNGFDTKEEKKNIIVIIIIITQQTKRYYTRIFLYSYKIDR